MTITALPVLLLFALSSANASVLDQKKFHSEREILNALIKLSSASVATESCNLKKAKVSDFIQHFMLLALQPEAPGRKRHFELKCEDRSAMKEVPADSRNCYLTTGEAIRLPNEPEGWERRLQFNYDFRTKSAVPGSFRCVDVP